MEDVCSKPSKMMAMKRFKKIRGTIKKYPRKKITAYFVPHCCVYIPLVMYSA